MSSHWLECESIEVAGSSADDSVQVTGEVTDGSALLQVSEGVDSECWGNDEAEDGTVEVGDGFDAKAGGGTRGGALEEVGGTDSDTGEETGFEVGDKHVVELLERALSLGAKSSRIGVNVNTESMTLPWSLPLT